MTQIRQSRADINQVILQRFTDYVEPFWQANVVTGYMHSQGQTQIAYAYVVHRDAIGSIAISSGRIECLVKYKELVFNLYNAGYSVFIHDHRGQGLSSRMTTNVQQGYVADFDEYVEDTKVFYSKVIRPNSRHMPMLLAHSMGSAIASLYLIKYPEDFVCCCMSAPMFGIRPALPNWLANLLVNLHLGLNALFSPAPWYFFGQKDYFEDEFERNQLTHSEARYQIFRREYNNNPDIQLGGVTASWLKAALKAMKKIDQQASVIFQPVLLLQAGSDQVVSNAHQLKIARKLSNCQLKTFPQARHELLMEEDDIRDSCLREALTFFSKHALQASDVA